jgi:cell division topological specificity factor MinE
LRNLDLIMGAERRVVYDLVNVIQGDAKLTQALIRDKRLETLFLLPASQTRDKDALTPEGVEWVIAELKRYFDWVICDSPAGIERGATLAMRHADTAVIVTNPEPQRTRARLFRRCAPACRRGSADLDPRRKGGAVREDLRTEGCMNIMNLFKRQKSAPMARERLQVLLAHERSSIGQTDLVAILREEILAVISKHVQLDADKVQVKLDRDKTVSLLEIDVEIPLNSALHAA